MSIVPKLSIQNFHCCSHHFIFMSTGELLARNLDISVDINELINQACGLTNITQRRAYQSQMIDDDNGRWVTAQCGGKLISACFHKSKNHSATCEVHNNFTRHFGVKDHVVRSAKSTAGPGEWAVAIVDSGRLGGDKTYYNID